MGDNKISEAWPDYLMIRDTGLHDDAGGLGQHIFTTAGAGYEKVKYVRADLAHLQGEAVPVAWFTEDHLTDRSATTYDPVVAERWRAKGWPVSPLFAHPQPAELSEVSGGCGELGNGVAGEWIRSAYGQPSSFTYWNMEVAFTAGWKHARDALAATGKQKDGCTESNCRRCLTHPDHRGDMPHAGIGSTGKQQVGENPAWRDELVREAHARGLMEGLNSPRPQQVGEVQGSGNG